MAEIRAPRSLPTNDRLRLRLASIADEDVDRAVRVVRNKVGRRGSEGRVAPVGACCRTRRLSWRLRWFASAPELSTLARSVCLVNRSWTKTSSAAFVSSGTRFEAPDRNETRRPSALIPGRRAPAEPACSPLLLTLAVSISPVARSRTKTSRAPFVSFGTKPAKLDVKATKRPSPLSAGARSRRPVSALVVADGLRRPRWPVADEDVLHAVGVSSDEIGSFRLAGPE